MIKSHKNLLLSFSCYILMVCLLYLIPHKEFSIIILSIIGIFFGVKSYRSNESKLGSIVLILIGIVLIGYAGLLMSLVSICGTGGDC
jgi:predicted membrane protein